MSIIIDRRVTGKSNSSENRQKFLRRHKASIKRAVNDALNKRSIKDFKKSGKDISVSRDSVDEHPFSTDNRNSRHVVPGNPKYTKGTKIPIQKGGKGKGGGGNGKGEGEDDFLFQVTKEELLEYFLDDLELPNLVKKALLATEEFKYKRAGYVSYGIPSNLNILRSYKNALGRQIAMDAALDHQIEEAEDKDQIALLEEERARIPFLDYIDLKYNLFLKEPIPITAAVMFCVMDVSGSMSEYKIELAKRFYLLLYLFLYKNYEKVEIVFVKHEMTAEETTEDDFFYGKNRGGGTIISSGLELVEAIQKERYPTNSYNVYIAQAGDGENFAQDDQKALEAMNRLRDISQHFFCVVAKETMSYGINYGGFGMNFETDYIKTMRSLSRDKESKVSYGSVHDYKDIYPVFRSFFERSKK